MKLYNIFQDIILEEISKDQELINEGTLEDIKSAMENTVYIWFKYKTADGAITDRYVMLDKLGTSLANNGVVRLWQTGGQTTKTKTNGGVNGWKLFRIDRIIPGSIKPTNMKYREPVRSGEPYNTNGDRKMKGAVTVANYTK
jgi:hypothetical protein